MPVKHLLLTCLLAFSFQTVRAIQEDAEPIVVRLATESALAPLYLSSLIKEDSQFVDPYLKQLEAILAFDFDHNGSTRVVKRTPDSDQLISSGSFEQLGHTDEWKTRNIYYVIKGKVVGNALNLIALDVNGQSLKNIGTIALSGNLNEDRRHIHKASDAVHKALFGTDGIASTRILYSIKLPTPKLIADIWESDYDGANARSLISCGAYCIAPTYLPPKPGGLSGGFMYVSYQIGQPKIYITSLKDLVGQRLTTLKGTQLMPILSRQRDKVAFISDVTGNPDLFIQPFNPERGILDKPYQVFAAPRATQSSPSFSPDGKQLAFVSDKDGSPRIYVIDIPTAGMQLRNVKATLISKQNRENTAPCWSPDGTKIAYCSRSRGERQIWMYDFTTNAERQLTQGAGNKENPSWAPNSKHLVFNSSDNNSSELFLINLNQPEATQITSGKGEKRFPNWEPRVK
jgi:TolB protein